MRTADLTGAVLDWHTARAEGVPAADLEMRANGTLCVRNIRGTPGNIAAVQVLDYSTNWALAGPLVEKHHFSIGYGHPYWWTGGRPLACDTPLIAICRAVVRSVFGDEVEDLPC